MHLQEICNLLTFPKTVSWGGWEVPFFPISFFHILSHVSNPSPQPVREPTGWGGNHCFVLVPERASRLNPHPIRAPLPRRRAPRSAQAFAVQLAVHDAMVKEQQSEGHFTADVEINDYHARAPHFRFLGGGGGTIWWNRFSLLPHF